MCTILITLIPILHWCGELDKDKVCMEVWDICLAGMHSCNLLECVGMCVWSLYVPMYV